jgi:sulfatase maturation enzyme AslB (radical SAM superfamily)
MSLDFDPSPGPAVSPAAGDAPMRRGAPAAPRPVVKPLDPAKFRDPLVTAAGEARASVALSALRTLWFNTGTLCNITCRHCYIESSPRNDRLVYLTRAEIAAYLDEIAALGLGTEEIGFTGGEPFMNPDIVAMLEDCLGRGFRVLVLTNAMRPMQRLKPALLALRERFGPRLAIRVSLDHYTPARHDEERGAGGWGPTFEGLVWLARAGFDLAVAGRKQWGGSEEETRAGYARLFAEHGIPVDAGNPARLVLFPEMDEREDVPEITERCWGILHKSPASVMCASSRMVVKRNGEARPAVVSCTLLPYDKQFELGTTLADALGAVRLNHPHCARFCVLGGASCSA